jgi:hypothetical protein
MSQPSSSELMTMACYVIAHRLLPLSLLVTCLAIIEGESSSGNSKYANYGILLRGMYLMASVPGETAVSFRTYADVDVDQCARECVLRMKCRSFNYGRKGECELNDVTRDDTVSASLVARSGFVYSEKETWPQVRTLSGDNVPEFM